MLRRIQKTRVVAPIANPITISCLEIPEVLKTTHRGELFYAYDSGKEDRNRFIIVTTTQNLGQLEYSKTWAIDGTFSVCPLMFHQLYSIHGIVKDTTVPLVYCLMKNKSREKYEEVFSALKNWNAMLSPHEIIIDFKIAATEALKSNSQNANVESCFFHFAQANWKKIQSVGLAVEYQENAEIRNILKCFASLAPIPESDIALGFKK